MFIIHDYRAMQRPTAYNETQIDDNVGDGDILLLSGGATAIMVKAWPVMVVGEADKISFHELQEGTTFKEFAGGAYYEAAQLAEKLATTN